MQCIVYTNLSDKKELFKDLTTLGTIEVTLKEETSMLNPSLLLNANFNWAGAANYCYIPAFDRYYYIKEVNSVRNNLWRIDCVNDPLMSWRDYILKQNAVIERQEFEYNLMLDDGTLKSYANPSTIIKNFPRGFNDTGYTNVLVGIGR